MDIIMPNNSCIRKENDVDEILPGLFLGNYKSSKDDKFLRENNIRYVFRFIRCFDFNIRDTVIKNKIGLRKTFFGYTYKIGNVTYFHFPIKDKDMCYRDLDKLFTVTNYLILKTYIKGANILVHCKRGHHRSATIIAAFLIKHFNMDYTTVTTAINKIRNCALRRDTCMVKGLFRYYSKIKKKKEKR